MRPKSQFRGVTWNPVKQSRQGPWRAIVSAGGRYIYAGRYWTEVEAARAYNEIARVMLGERAKLNEVEA